MEYGILLLGGITTSVSTEWEVCAKNKDYAKGQPAHEVRLGQIKATIWRNETQNGVRYNVTFARIYKEGDEWRSTESFGRDDLFGCRQSG